MPQLSIYKASAGSGKTYRLTVEYIKLLLNDPQCYRNILAVTFTNKATAEMKNRILSTLHDMAKGNGGNYINTIRKETGYDETFIRKQAFTALTNLLHNYSYFKVETIDSFFQRVLRNLVKELKLNGNMRLELNNDQMVDLAVDDMVENLDNKSKTLNWIISLIDTNIENEKSWNVIRTLKKFGNNIFSDEYKHWEKELTELCDNENFFNAYTKQLVDIEKQTKDFFANAHSQYNDILQRNALSAADFNKNTISYFNKLTTEKKWKDAEILTQTVEKAIEDFNVFLRKADQHPEKTVYQVAKNELHPLLIRIEKQRRQILTRYYSALKIKDSLSLLRLLGSIQKKMKEMNTEANVFLLSDTQALLSGLINHSDSPFIFEKIGTSLKYIMIDEFQDTSINQWRNFKVLLDDCMANGDSRNLIVGDVKQSIYRWRNGDWKLLNNIEDYFNKDSFSVEPLNVNRRSAVNIIDFNNEFFAFATQHEANQLKKDGNQHAGQLMKAYENLEQKFPEQKEASGYVEMTLYGDKEENTNDKMLSDMGNAITQLLQSGIQQRQIAILARSKSNLKNVVDHFAENFQHINVVTDEAFYLNSSVAVNIMMNALRYIVYPKDKITLAAITKNYQTQIEHHTLNEDDLSDANISDMHLLPEAYRNLVLSHVNIPIDELLEQIYRIFRLDTCYQQGAYICSFFDYANKFIYDTNCDIEQFIEYWEETLCTKSIQSDEAEGIRAMTIHKSKGLEFDYVFVPNCDWKLELGGTLWLEPKTEPFNRIPVMPIEYKDNTLSDTIFAEEWQEEHLQNMVDNLNLLYVLFTRPRTALHIYAQRSPSATRRSYLLEQFAEYATQQTQLQQRLSQQIIPVNKQDDLIFCFGNKENLESNNNRSKQSHSFAQPTEHIFLPIKSYESKAELLQSNASKAFIDGEDNDEQQQQYIQEGSLLHSVFARIKTADDVDGVLREFEFEGLLPNGTQQRARLKHLIDLRMKHPKAAEWFSPHWQLFNECTILTTDPSTGLVKEWRPDRVMRDENRVIVVDYKFGNPKSSYYAQVRNYMHLLCQMGYEHVEGYLWFIYSNQIEEVKLQKPTAEQ